MAAGIFAFLAILKHILRLKTQNFAMKSNSENRFTFIQKNSECHLDPSSSNDKYILQAIPNVFAFSGEITECLNSFSNCLRAVFAMLSPRFAT